MNDRLLRNPVALSPTPPSIPVDVYRLIFMRSGRLTFGGTVLEPF